MNREPSRVANQVVNAGAGRLALTAALVLFVFVAPVAGVTHLKRGMKAPPVELTGLDGADVDTAEWRGRTVVLIFGELYHERTLAACGDVRAVLARTALADQPIMPLLIVAQNAPPGAMQTRAADAGISWRIGHDVDRRVFGAYRITVMPSVVVVDENGLVVHAAAGYTPRFSGTVADSIFLAVGAIDQEQFEERLHPGSNAEAGAVETRAARVTKLARELARRGLPELAEEKYVEALEIAPTHVPARLGLGLLQLEQGRLAKAELEFRAVLVAEPNAIDARLGLAFVQTLRGGEEVAEAETLVHEVLANSPFEPRAHYLMGRIHQERHELEEAATSFRTATELLMSQRGTWDINRSSVR